MGDPQDTLRRRAAAVPWQRLQPTARLYLIDLAAGFDQRAIAARRGRALGTVNGTLQTAARRAGAASTADLVALAACYIGQGGDLITPNKVR